MINLKVIIASTREGRKGPSVAAWIFEKAKKHAEFNTELLDLAKINLPFLNEPEPPSKKKYTKQYTKDWSAIIEPAEAFIVVTPEYNYGYPATLKNAFDTIYQEWNNKPIAFVSYGGIAGGTRAVQSLQPVLTALKLIPISENIHIASFTNFIDEQGKFNANETHEKSAGKMFKELEHWVNILNEVRIKSLNILPDK